MVIIYEIYVCKVEAYEPHASELIYTNPLCGKVSHLEGLGSKG